MNIKRCFFIFIVLITIFSGLTLAITNEIKQKKTIALFTGRSETDPFWGPVRDFMKVACDDLGMSLKVYYAENDRNEMKKQILDAVTSSPPADAIVFPNFKHYGYKFLEISDKYQVPALVFNSGINQDSTENPGIIYKYWISETRPDDMLAGFKLANILIKTAIKNKTHASDGKIHMIGINGIASEIAAIERVKGLKLAVKNREDVILHQIVAANWEYDLTRKKFFRIMERYPETSVIWTAADMMAIEVAKAIKDKGLIPGKDIVTGGMDWIPEILPYINKGDITASAGGHFMEGAWAAIILYDYFNGIPIPSTGILTKYNMNIISKSNIHKYSKLLVKKNWNKINFKKFSKQLNPKLKKYDFNIKKVIKHIESNK